MDFILRAFFWPRNFRRQMSDEGTEAQRQSTSATVQEISGGQHDQTFVGGQFGQYIQTQVNKTYNPVGASGSPQREGEFQVGCLITVHENSPISLSSRIFNATLHSDVTGDKKAAVKITPAERKNYREAEIHFSVPHHKNIVERIATDTFNFRGQPSIFIAMELCDCNLYDHIQMERKNEVPFDTEKYIRIAYQTLQGLAFLHLHNVVHGDLKPPNVLLILNGNYIRLSDFGLSKPITSGKDSTVLTSPQAGTLGWQAPEVLKGAEKISTATDIFPGGLVLYFVFSHGEHAYGEELYSLSHNIANGVNRDLSKMRIHNSDIAEPLVRQMLQNDPTKRPTAKQALANEIFDSHEPKPPKLTDSKLHEIINSAVDEVRSQPSKVKNNGNRNVEEVTPLGVTLAQLSNAMNVIFEEKKISVSGGRQATDGELQEIIEKAMKRWEYQGGKMESDAQTGDERSSLSFTLDQLANAIEVYQRNKLHLTESPTSEEAKAQLGDKAQGSTMKTEDQPGKKSGILEVFIEMSSGRVITLEVEDSDTVESIKHRIAGIEQIPLCLQILHFNDVLLNDDSTLRQCNVKNKAIITLIIDEKIRIHINALTEKTFTLVVGASNTIKSVKKLIEHKEGIPANKQKLIFFGRQLEDGRTLKDCDIHERSTLRLFLQLRRMTT